MSVLIIILTTIIVILLHYEFLATLVNIKIKHRLSLVFIVVVLLISHILQVFVFATGFYILNLQGLGSLSHGDQSFDDFLYFSFSTFSTLGYGDLNPLGGFRFLAGLEALLGFILITWSASFLYFEMQKYWNKQ